MNTQRYTPRGAALCLVLVLSPACQKKDPPEGVDPAAQGPGTHPAALGAPATPAAPGAPGSLSGFEGEIEVKVKSTAAKASPEQTLRLLVKGDRLRMDIPPGLEPAPGLGGAPRSIFDVKAQKITTIVDEKKMAITMDLSRFAEQAKALTGGPGTGASKAGSPPPKVTRTGRTDTVAGYRCEEWDIVASTGEQSHVCVVKESAPFFSFPAASLPADQAWARELFDGKHLPLRFVSKGKTGAEEARVEVQKIERKSLAETEFAIPAGYKTMDMAELTRGLIGGMPSALSPGLAMPPGAQLPSGLQLPKGVQVPPEAARMLKEMQERAKAAQQQK